MKNVVQPKHYQHPSGVTCLEIVRGMSFLRGNCVKYTWRAGNKGNLRDDLMKAKHYLQLLHEFPDRLEKTSDLPQKVDRYQRFEKDVRRSRLIELLSLEADVVHLTESCNAVFEKWLKEECTKDNR